VTYCRPPPLKCHVLFGWPLTLVVWILTREKSYVQHLIRDLDDNFYFRLEPLFSLKNTNPFKSGQKRPKNNILTTISEVQYKSMTHSLYLTG
jgi:hypothetical protein